MDLWYMGRTAVRICVAKSGIHIGGERAASMFLVCGRRLLLGGRVDAAVGGEGG